MTGTLALDGVQLAILKKRLEGVCRKMANTLFRTGRSGVLNAARYRGGGGMQVEFGPEGCDLEIGYVSNGTVNAANGARGGGSGGRAQQYVRRGNGEGETLDPCVQVPLSEGEFIVSISCGGGGFGSPLACPAVDVAHDARERCISIEAAEHVYGVVLSADGSADIAASEALRNRMSAAVF